MQRICVYCGSNPGARPEYAAAARELARACAERGLGLVYGGGKVGLMGVLADAARAQGSEVIGVIPRALYDQEVAHTGVSKLEVVGSMHERKARMAELADAFLALPGGLGTLEELFEVWTWTQLGFHAKPCGLLDVAGYYAPLVAFLGSSVAEGFVLPEHRAALLVGTDAGALLDGLSAWRPVPLAKWLEREAL
jgi:uncharacterized protein (TIGR00730 family)